MGKGKIAIGLAITASAAMVTSTDLIPEFEIHRPVDTAAMLDVSVTIKTVSHVTIDQVGDSVWEAGSGSGFLVSGKTCELWTAQHVIKDAAIIEVFPRGWSGAQGIPAHRVNSTPRPDVAVLRMDYCEGLAVARLGQSSTLKAGAETYAVGNPLGLNPDSISRGIVSHTKRYLKGSTVFLQTDAAINPGNSGGPLFNRTGEVIGMNTAIASTTGKNIGIGYAVPIDQVKATVKALRSGPPQWGDAGIDGIVGTLTRDEARLFKLPRAQGAAILTSSPEAGPAAGRLFARDVVYRIGAREVTDAQEAIRAISEHNAGDSVAFNIVRAGEHQTVSITLANGWSARAEKKPAHYEGILGMDVEMWSDARHGTNFETPIITQVHSLGPAHRAHISSSQRNMAIQGRAVVPYQLDVKTITGLVYEGSYHEVPDVETLNAFATRAQGTKTPLLLEIQLWGRRNHTAIHESLEHITTAFFRLQPQRAGGQDELANSRTDRSPGLPSAPVTAASEAEFDFTSQLEEAHGSVDSASRDGLSGDASAERVVAAISPSAAAR